MTNPTLDATAAGTLRPSDGFRLGRHHTAFLRALIQGIDWREAAQRYLFEAYSGRRQVGRLLRELEDALSRASELARRPTLLRDLPLSRLLPAGARSADVGALPGPTEAETPVLSYRAWCAQQPEDFFSEQDLRDRYADYLSERKATTTAVRPRPRAAGWDVARALAALRELERHAVRPAAPDDPCAAWMHPALAASLADVGVTTLGELVAYMNRHGFRWYRRVRRVGRQRARSIARWLAAKAPGQALTTVATTPRTALSFTDFAAVRTGRGSITPLELLVAPSALSGIDGANREWTRVCQLGVNTDRDAIVRWLHAVAANDNTLRAYRREAERVLLWCLYEKGKPLSSMTVGDAIEYREFLLALVEPQAAWHWQTQRDAWIGARSHPRLSPNWRPFEGRMSPRSIERALRIVRHLFAWLAEQAYLAGSPWAGVKLSVRSHARRRHLLDAAPAIADKALAPDEAAAVLAYVDALPADERGLRARLLVRLGLMVGLRRDELAHATAGWCRRYRGNQRLLLAAVGKGGKTRELPLPVPVEAALAAYLAARGLPRDPLKCPPATPLIARLAARRQPHEIARAQQDTAGAALSPSRLYAMVRRFIELAAHQLEEQGARDLANELRQRRRTHALRHTFGTLMAEQGVPMPVVQAWMGHADPKTTAGYYSPRPGTMFELIDRALERASEPSSR